MKYPTIILALSLLLTACRRNDAEFTKQIPGVWKEELKTYTNVLTIVADGSFSYSRITANPDTTFTNTGTWWIRGGRIVLTATTRSGAHALPLGDIIKTEINHLDDHNWMIETDDEIGDRFTR